MHQFYDCMLLNLLSLHLLKHRNYGKKSRREENGKKGTFKNGKREERRKAKQKKFTKA